MQAGVFAVLFISYFTEFSGPEIELGNLATFSIQESTQKIDLREWPYPKSIRLQAVGGNLEINRINYEMGHDKSVYFLANELGLKAGLLSEGESVLLPVGDNQKIDFVSVVAKSNSDKPVDVKVWGTFRKAENRQKTASDALECRFNGHNNQPYYTQGKYFIGRSKYGFIDASECEDNIKKSKNGLVCNWAGKAYSIYAIERNQPVSPNHSGYYKLSDCQQVVSDSTEELVCHWNGLGFAPYYTRRPGNVGQHMGMSTYNGCLKLIEGRRGDFMCNWNGKSYQPYSVNKNIPIGKAGYGFSSFDSCLDVVERSTRNQICQHFGNGIYGVYDVREAVDVPLRTYVRLEDCVASLK